MTTNDVFELHDPDIAPEPPPKGPRVWAADNLFSSPASSVFTLLAIGVVILFIKSILGFIMDDGRRWESVFTNMKLYMTQSYPADQYVRVWVSLGVVVGLATASLAAWRSGGQITVRTIVRTVFVIGASVVGLAVISADLTAVRVTLALAAAIGGLFLAVTSSGVLEGSYRPQRIIGSVFFGLFSLVGVVVTYVAVAGSTSWSIPPSWYLSFGAIAAAACITLKILGDRAKTTEVHSLLVVVGVAALIIGSLWVAPYGQYTFVDGQVGYASGTVAKTTSGPWTMMLIVGVAIYFGIKALTRSDAVAKIARRILVFGWILSLPVIVLLILRDPDFSPEVEGGGLDFLVGTDVWALLIFALAGGAVLAVLSLQRLGELARVVAAILFIGSILLWLWPMPIRFRLMAFIFSLFAIGAQTFVSDARSRVRYVLIWVAYAALLIYFFAALNTPSSLQIQAKSFLGGLTLTFVLALTSIFLSFPIGVVMALGRTSTMPVFRVLSTMYIELVRGVPFITILIFFDLILVLFLPKGLEFDAVTLAILGGTLFSGAYLAENVRGGLQSIPRGQYEAASATGLSTLQLTVFIVLPQALRAVVPALVGQTIAIFKDTSLVAIIGLFDFLFIADKVIPAQTVFLGAKLENIVFIAAVYWIFTFSFSRASLRIERKLGLGER
ncbi:amino acid ABC transporter permease [bacterium]|nr:amino acid ABC transporter permease [bacterium]